MTRPLSGDRPGRTPWTTSWAATSRWRSPRSPGRAAVRRAARASRLPHRLLGWVDADGFAVVVP
ncbi:MAG: hypothetical protein J2P19_29510, partial [Pseudonocardia sp.]|nr:hypothetical protein [Pseudonocardia sp.]